MALGFGMDYYRGRWRVQEAWMTGSQLSARFRPILASCSAHFVQLRKGCPCCSVMVCMQNAINNALEELPSIEDRGQTGRVTTPTRAGLRRCR